MTIALCLCIACIAALIVVSCFALWTAWAVAGVLRASLRDAGARHDALQARFTALAFDARGSAGNAATALDQAAPARQHVPQGWPEPTGYQLPHTQPLVDELAHMAGG